MSRELTARIREDKENNLWLFVDREGDVKNHPDDIAAILGIKSREEDLAGRVAYAILPEEVEAIRNACNEYLEEQSQEYMKGGL